MNEDQLRDFIKQRFQRLGMYKATEEAQLNYFLRSVGKSDPIELLHTVIDFIERMLVIYYDPV